MAALALATFHIRLDQVVELSERIRLQALHVMSDARFAQNGAGGTRFKDPSAGDPEASTPVLAILRRGALYASPQ